MDQVVARRTPGVPNPIDRHVGARVRMRRVLLGISQERLAGVLGLTFQQIQKYEKGTNRISASRLQEIARTLDVPAAFFFEGLPGCPDVVPDPGKAGNQSILMDFLGSSEGVRLATAYTRIAHRNVRMRILDLVEALADDKAHCVSGDGPLGGE